MLGCVGEGMEWLLVVAMGLDIDMEWHRGEKKFRKFDRENALVHVIQLLHLIYL